MRYGGGGLDRAANGDMVGISVPTRGRQQKSKCRYILAVVEIHWQVTYCKR